MPQKGSLLLRRVAQGVGDAQGHRYLVAVYQEAPDLGLAGVTLDELLIAVRHSRLYPSKCNTNAFSEL